MAIQEPQQAASTSEVADRMTSRIANSLVIAAGLVALGLYASGDSYRTETPTYQAVATPDGRVVRLNTDSGSIVSCDTNGCTLVYLGGEELPRPGGRRTGQSGEGQSGEGQSGGGQSGEGRALPAPAAPAQPALPAPSTAPATPEAGAAQPPAQPQRVPAQ